MCAREAEREMRARDAEAARKIREAKAQIELADIEAEIKREIAVGSLASSRRSRRTICEHERSTITGSRAVPEYKRKHCTRPIANCAVQPAVVASTQSLECCIPEINY